MPKDKVKYYIDIYNELSKVIKWKVPDKRIIMMAASIYVMNQKEFRMNHYLEIADELKRHAGFFSPMKSYLRFTVAAMLDVNFDNPSKEIPELYHIYEKFRQNKFSSSSHTYIASSLVLTRKQTSTSSVDDVIKRSKAIHDKMKKNHAFLTGYEDYPLATLIAYHTETNINDKVEGFYNELNKNGFRKGNHLQFLSHILVLEEDKSPVYLVSRCTSIFDTFRQANIRPKASHYSAIGLLALLPSNAFDMNEVVDLYQALNEHIKWQKDMNLLLAVCLYATEKLDANITEAGIHTVMEAIIQAQQAVIISSITDISSSTSSDSGGGGD
ncbi:DUF4003 domain-containing protein [Oceanobacillus piezotolerans]|uniref:DUF4003 domain-containing protein n=1 Tax=Oceanobacillus piezotolerans TaxID=2448030 RepID=A0A498D960_9BACI|nr:DUF4003 family protein [Oceanobacillus piezotolerans]RLL42836.1 DUF4003 domain-containing protein [Oceanobacillus piezotolerans]